MDFELAIIDVIKYGIRTFSCQDHRTIYSETEVQPLFWELSKDRPTFLLKTILSPHCESVLCKNPSVYLFKVRASTIKHILCSKDCHKSVLYGSSFVIRQTQSINSLFWRLHFVRDCHIFVFLAKSPVFLFSLYFINNKQHLAPNQYAVYEIESNDRLKESATLR